MPPPLGGLKAVWNGHIIAQPHRGEALLRYDVSNRERGTTVRMPEPLSGLTPRWLVVTGIRAVLLLAIAGLVWVGFYIYSITAGFLVPLIIATILGMLFSPVVDRLQTWHVPRSAGAIVVMLGLGAAAAGTILITAQGIIGQWDEISSQLQAGLVALQAWLHTLDIPAEYAQRIQVAVESSVGKLAGGVGNALGSGLASTAAFLFGTFLGAFMLFYILTDWADIRAWAGCNVGLPRALGEDIVEDAVSAMRQYFAGVTISGLIVAIVIGVGLAFLKVPLIIPIMLVTFLTAYIPYFGAIISSVFACLIALSSGGVPAALGVLVVILVAQNVIQTIVTNQIASDKLNIHPLVGLLATLAGGVFLGLLGGVLGTPLAALMLRASARLGEHRGGVAGDAEPQAE